MLRDHFAEHGHVRLPGAFAELADALAATLWAVLERRHGIVADDPTTWTVAEPRGLAARGHFDAVGTPAVRAAIEKLTGVRDPHPFSWGDPLVTFPSPGRWDVPTGGWHLDFPARSALRLKWLGYLAPVPAGGGGTVVLAGSHRLVAAHLRELDPADPGRSPAVRAAVLGAHPWLRAIGRPGGPADRIAELMTRGARVSDVDVRVVELTGEPGDVVFLHPHLFHAPAANRSTTPRLMITGGLAG
ncbi:MAG TPA: phytanoyl-CoA dioxygenase family protein [Actinophytocola sp.]|nr:phytanoyl-CoA dioxygenase family protein [Actinophytocola sp.]